MPLSSTDGVQISVRSLSRSSRTAGVEPEISVSILSSLRLQSTSRRRGSVQRSESFISTSSFHWLLSSSRAGRKASISVTVSSTGARSGVTNPPELVRRY